MGARFRAQTYTSRTKSPVAKTNREALKRPGGNNAFRKPWVQGLINWDARYGDKWEYSRKVAKAHRYHEQVGSVCLVCLWRKATQMHHCEYQQEEELGYNWFPVCDRCHAEIAHHPANWIKDKFNPCLCNRNTDEFVEKLRLNWKILYEGIERE